MPSVKHAFVSGVADGADATKVRPSNWNASHTSDGAWTWAHVTKVSSNYVAYKYDSSVISTNSNAVTVIQAAIDACSAAGGGRVLTAPCGVMSNANTTITGKAGVVLEFEANWAQTSDTTQPVFYGASIVATGANRIIDVPVAATGFKLLWAALDGNDTAASCVRSQCGMFQMDHVCLVDATIGWEASDGGGFVLDQRLSDFTIWGGDPGISLGSGITDCHISHGHIKRATTASMTVNAGGSQFHDIHFTGSTATPWHVIDSRTGAGTDFANLWTNCYFDTALGHMKIGINSGTNYGRNEIVGCFFAGPAGTGSPSPQLASILVDATKPIFSVIGCHWKQSSSSQFTNIIRVTNANTVGSAWQVIGGSYESDIMTGFSVSDAIGTNFNPTIASGLAYVAGFQAVTP